LVEHDPAVSAARERSRDKTGLARLKAIAGIFAWRRFERRALQAVQAVVVFTAEDAHELRKLEPDAPVVVIPLGIASPDRPLNTAADEAEVVFVGSFFHTPNVDAAIRLAGTIMPRVLQTLPEARLRLVGSRASAEVRS